jgi:hypothetical protein
MRPFVLGVEFTQKLRYEATGVVRQFYLNLLQFVLSFFSVHDFSLCQYS